MNFQVAKDTVDWLYENYLFRAKNKLGPAPHDIPAIVFFGGEPTLRWDDIIVPIIDYIKQKKYRFRTSITTNCTLLNKERIDFLINNNTGILISMDGDKPTQDLTRPCKNGQSSFDLMIDNVKYLLERNPNFNMRATLNPENASQLFHNYLFAEELGFKNCSFVTNKREKWPEESIQILENEVAKIYQYHLEYFKKNIVPPLQPGMVLGSYYSAIEYKGKSEENKIPIQCNYPSCSIGRNYLAVNHEGKIFACQQEVSPDSIFELGDIYNGIDIKRQMNLLNTITDTLHEGLVCENPKVCKNCKNIVRCQQSFCAAAIMDRFSSFKIQPEISCRYKNAYINNALIMLNELKGNQCFAEYLRDDCGIKVFGL